MKNNFKRIIIFLLIITVMLPNNIYATNTETQKETVEETKSEEEKEKEEAEKKAKEEAEKKAKEEAEKKKNEDNLTTLDFNKQKNAILENSDQNGNLFGSVPNRQFMKILTKDGNLYYLMVEYDDVGEEVKLLKEISDKDLLSLADDQLQKEIQDKMNKENPDETNTNQPKETKETKPNTQIKNKKGNDFGVVQIILLGIVVIGSAVVYTLYKKKKANSDSDYPGE